MVLVAGRIAVSAAVAAVQLEADGARARFCAFAGPNLVAADAVTEAVAEIAVRQRHDDIEIAAAGAAERRLVAVAFGVLQADDIVRLAVAGEVDRAHGVRRELDLLAV